MKRMNLKLTVHFLLLSAMASCATGADYFVAGGTEAQLFVDPARHDFRPTPGGPLDATGVAVEGIVKGHEGRPPSIGAFILGRQGRPG